MYLNLKWLPSRSTNPRENTAFFWRLVLPKDHQFWKTNQPGNLWNCKCNGEETDHPTAKEYPKTKIVEKRLEGNPAITREVFTEKGKEVFILPKLTENKGSLYKYMYKDAYLKKTT